MMVLRPIDRVGGNRLWTDPEFGNLSGTGAPLHQTAKRRA
jgi:hypothetical protein